MLNDLDCAKQEYNKLERMRNTKVKGAKVSPLFNWEFMDAVYLVSRKDYKQSLNVFKSVNTENMNPREKIQYYYQFTLLCNKIKEKHLCEGRGFMKMTKEVVDKRRKKIMQKIQVKGTVNVEELASELNVTPLTIRRDLQYWEDMGAIERFYGGAKLVQNFVEHDIDPNEAYKHAIAKFAATFVDDGDTIFINTSSTALLVIKYIIGKRVTIITNNGKAIFCDHDPNVQIVMTGGELRFPKETMTGDFALNNLQRVKANKAFLGCNGFDNEVGAVGLPLF